MDRIQQIEKELSDLKSIFSSLNNTESQLEKDFLTIFSSGNGTEENFSGETVSAKPKEMEESENKEEEKQNSDIDIDSILEAEDNPKVETLEWDNFSIDKSDEYSNKLQQEQGLNLDDANRKSFFIKYKSPDELLAVDGEIFSVGDEQNGLVTVGGYGTKENMGKDLEYMKNLWETGFPVKEKDKLLVTIDKLSPSLQHFDKLKETEQIDESEQKQPANVEEKKEEPKPEIQQQKPQTQPTQPQQKTSPKPEIPKPVGNIKSFVDYRAKIMKIAKEI
jgi:hypothetical protein